MFLSTCRMLMRYQKFTISPVIQAQTAALPNAVSNIPIAYRALSSDVDPKDITKSAVKKERTKTPEIPKITLLSEDDKILCVTTVDEAEKMAASKNIRLVKIVDKGIRTARPIYKLMPEAQFIVEDLKSRKEKREERKKSGSFIKGEKALVMSSTITTSDYEVKLRKALKWLEKKYEIRVLITGSPDNANASLQEQMYKKMENTFKGKSRIVQKISKSGNLKIHILPLKDEDHTTTTESNSTKDESNLMESSTV